MVERRFFAHGVFINVRAPLPSSAWPVDDREYQYVNNKFNFRPKYSWAAGVALRLSSCSTRTQHVSLEYSLESQYICFLSLYRAYYYSS